MYSKMRGEDISMMWG